MIYLILYCVIGLLIFIELARCMRQDTDIKINHLVLLIIFGFLLWPLGIFMRIIWLWEDYQIGDKVIIKRKQK